MPDDTSTAPPTDLSTSNTSIPVADASGSIVSVQQSEVDTAAKVYNDAAQTFDYWQQKVMDYATDTSVDASTKTQASAQADSARAAMGRAANAYGTILNRVSSERAAQARAAKDPNEQALWAAEADKAKAQADLVGAEGQMALAKDQATIDSLQQKTQIAVQNAQVTASKAQSLESLQSSQKLLTDAKAAVLPAMSQSVIDLHTSTIQKNAAYVKYLGQRGDLATSQAGLADAKAALVSGPQAQSLLSKAELDDAKAAGLNLDQGATLDKIQAAAHLSDARVQQIAANISKSQVLPYNDKTEPNLTIFQPSTGKVTGVPNPGYVNTALQGITDTNSAISSIQQDIAAGNMSPDEGTALIDALRQSLQYKAMGVTPDQYVTMQNQQAQTGLNVLSKYQDLLTSGPSNALSQYMAAAQKSTKPLPAFNGYSAFGGIANAIYGPDIKKAQDLISQVTPITDRLSALKNVALLGQAKAALTGAPVAPTSSNPNPQQPPAQPPQSAPGPQGQTNTQGPSAAFMQEALANPQGQTSAFWNQYAPGPNSALGPNGPWAGNT